MRLRRVFLLVLPALLLIAGSAAAVLFLSRGSPEQPGAAVREEGIPTPLVTTLTPTPLPSTPTPTPTPPPSDAPIARIVIEKIGVNAPVSVKGIDRNGVMQDPNGPWDVAWYDFSAKPGWGGNAVFSGHVDYVNVGPAVFWGLQRLTEGDIVKVRLTDGTEYEYRVISNVRYSAYNAPVGEIIGSTEKESVTLITCGGTWDARAREYSHRVVVRAERVQDQPRASRQ